MPENKNVLLITIDGLRFDRTGFGGHTPSPSPFMDALMHKGLSLSNAFSTSFPTQFAMPSLFTSTLPLDSGGYDAGIRDRDTSFVEVLQQNGYRTAGFFNGFWGSDLFYYDRGFDNFYTCVSPKLVAESFSNIYLPQLFRTYNATKSIEKCVAYFKPLLADFFTWFNVFCTQKEKEITSNSFVVSAVTHNWDFSGIQAIVQAEQKKFKKNPRTYIKKLLSQQGRSRFDEIAGHYRKRTDLEKKARSASAARMFESTARLMDHYISEDPSTPFFIWTHLMDVHDCIYSPHDVIYEASHDVMEDQGLKKQEVHELKKLSRQIAATGEAYQGSPRYDLATRSCDLQLERLVSWMRSMGILQDTLIVLTSDHGFRKAGYPPREDIDVGDFFDELHKVPLAFIAEDIKSGRLDMLHSSMDVGPSLLDYLGMDIPRSFKGGSVFDPGFSTTGHPGLVFESMGRLLCDFESKPVNVCVRDTRSKMTCSLQPGASTDQCQVVSYFDLQDDPYELHNLAGSREDFDSHLKSLAADRLARILADRDQAAASRPGKARAPEFEARANIEPDNADFHWGRFQETHLHSVEKPGHEPQVTWQTYLVGLPYARDLMQTWQYIMLDADYEQALNLYLSSTQDTLPLEKRYQDLLQSQALLLGCEKDQARHMSTSMLLVRIYTDLGERRQAASIAGELLNTLQDAGELHLHRPFVPPIKSFETQPVRRNHRSWLTASAMEAIARLQDDTGYHSCQEQIKYLNFACSLPEHSLEMERRLALCAMRSGQDVSVDPQSWLVSNDHLNKAIWEDMAGLGQQAVMEEQMQLGLQENVNPKEITPQAQPLNKEIARQKIEAVRRLNLGLEFQAAEDAINRLQAQGVPQEYNEELQNLVTAVKTNKKGYEYEGIKHFLEEKSGGLPDQTIGSWNLQKKSSMNFYITGQVTDHSPRVYIFVDDLLIKSVKTDAPENHHNQNRTFQFALASNVINTFNKQARIIVTSDTGNLLHNNESIIYDYINDHGYGTIQQVLDCGHVIHKKGSFVLRRDKDYKWQNEVLSNYQALNQYFEKTFGYTLWLMFGTLLGFCRNKNFIPNDDDFDVAYLSSHSSPQKVKKEMIKISHKMIDDGWQTTIGQNGILKPLKDTYRNIRDTLNSKTMDIYPVWIQKGIFYAQSVVAIPLARKDIHPLQKDFLNDKEVWIPQNYDKFLSHIFGKNWRKPDPSFDHAIMPGSQKPLFNARPSTADIQKVEARLNRE